MLYNGIIRYDCVFFLFKIHKTQNMVCLRFPLPHLSPYSTPHNQYKFLTRTQTNQGMRIAM